MDVLPQRLLRRPARRGGAGGDDLAIAQGRSPVDPLFHHRELPRDLWPEPLRVLPGPIHRGGDLLAGRSDSRLGRGAARGQSRADDQAAAAVPTRDRRDPRGRHRRGAEPRAGGADHHSRGRHAGLLVRCDAMAPHQHAGAVRVARLLPRALRRDQSAGGLQRDELVGPGLLDPANRPARAGDQSDAKRRDQRRRVSDRDRRIRSARTARRRSRPICDRRLGTALPRRRRWRAGRPLPEPCRLGRHSDVALLLVVFLAANRGRSVGAHVAVSRGLLPDDGVSIDGAGRRRVASGQQHLRRQHAAATGRQRPRVLRSRQSLAVREPGRGEASPRRNAAPASKPSG